MRNLELKKNLRLLAILFVSALAFNACSDDDHDDHDHDDHDDHDHEEINRMIYTLTNTENASDLVIMTFDDPDGELGDDGTTTVVGTLSANSTYSGAVQFLHVHEDGDIDDIGADIAEDEADEHEVFYSTSLVTVEKLDKDANGNDLGMVTTVTTGDAGEGPFTITLVHEGKKPNTGLEDALSGEGTPDIEQSFSITVE